MTDQLIVRKRNSEISNFFALLVSVKISEHDRLKFIYSYFDLFIFAVIPSTRNYKQKHWYIFQESGVGQKAAVMQTQRELRFLSFASVEYEGNVYMTPQDFLESVTEEVPRRKCAVMRFFCSDTFVLSDRFHFILASTYCGQEDLNRAPLHSLFLLSFSVYSEQFARP